MGTVAQVPTFRTRQNPQIKINPTDVVTGYLVCGFALPWEPDREEAGPVAPVTAWFGFLLSLPVAKVHVDTP